MTKQRSNTSQNKRWFFFGKRYRKNRRVHSSQKRRIGARFFHYFIKILKPLFVIMMIGSFSYFAWSKIQNNEYFALKKIIIPPHLSIKKQTLLKMAGLYYGMNLLTTNLSSISRRLKRHPRVDWVKLKRDFPSTLTIEIRLHKPVAIVKLKHNYLIDKLGRPFAQIERKKQYKKLLLLTGFRRQHYKEDPHTMQNLFRQALAIHRLYVRQKLNKYQQVREIQYDPMLGYILHSGQSRIYLGSDKYKKRLKRLKLIYQLLWLQGTKKLHYIYVNNTRNPRRAIIRLRDAISVNHLTSPVKKL